MGWKAALVLSLGILIGGCATGETVKRDTAKDHYKIYPDMPLTRIGSWTQTDIKVPREALVALMAEGEVWDAKDPSKKRLNPTACLKFKIREKGVMRGLSRFGNFGHVTVFKNTREGFLYYNIGPFLKEPWNKRTKMIGTVIVWEKEHVDKVDADIQELIRAHPDKKPYQVLAFPLAGCLTEIGDYTKAEMVLKRLRGTEWEYGWMAVTALTLSAQNESWLGRYDRTKIYAEEALDICKREGYKAAQAEALLKLAEATWCLKRHEEAIELAGQTLRLSQQIHPPSNYIAGRAHQTLGFLNLWAGRLTESLNHGEKAVEQLRRARAWRPLSQSYLYLGLAQRKLNMKDDARRSYESAIKVAGAIGRTETLWRAHSQLGRMAEEEGDAREAFKHYAEAINIIESLRGELGDPSLKALYMENKFYVYEWMIRLLHRMKREDVAFHYLERSKARIMLDMLRDKAFVSQGNELNDLLARERSLRDELQERINTPTQLSLRVSEEEGPGDESQPESREEENPELERLQSELKSVVERIEQLDPDMASLVAVNPLRAKEIQALLDDETALLAYFIGTEWNEVFIVTRDKVVALSLDTPRKKIIDRLKEFRSQVMEGVSIKLYTSKDYEKALTELYEILIRPVEGHIAGKRHLVVVPHGALHYLPFQALRFPDGRYLIDSFTVSYLPSASVLKYARIKNRGNHTDFFAAANPVTDLAPLPAAEVEASEVSTLFERKLVLIGPVATKSKVKIEGPRYDYLLFSTHGEMIESDPLKSNLRFTATAQDDGKLTVGEIFDMEVKANLVTLSACETGLARGMGGDLPRGDDLVGLSRAFIHAGAPSVVASLWRVSDDSTVAMMRLFYRNLRTMSKAEALRQAELELAKSNTQSYSHPFFWAPFILVGDWK